MPKSDAPDGGVSENQRLAFDFYMEVGIIHQLSRTRLERRLPEGIILAHFSVLSHMVRTTDGKSPSTLARILQVPRANMTNTLGGLEKGGYIAVEPNPRDGRSKLVYLTEAGRQLIQGAVEKFVPELDQLGERFDISKLASVMPVLSELREVMDRYRDEGLP